MTDGRILRLAPLLGRFRSDRSAVSAVEFALVVPFLLLLYLGGSELSVAITLDRKIQNASTTVADLVTQLQTTSAAEVNTILDVSRTIVEPYDSSKVEMVVTSVWVDAEGEATVRWACAINGADQPLKDDVFPLPAEFAEHPDRSILVTSTRYEYTPLGGYGLKVPITMGDTAYLNPRSGSEVDCPDCCPPPEEDPA